MNSRILPAFSLIIAVAIFFVYINPMWTGKIAATNASIAGDKLDLAAANDYIAQQTQLAQQRDQIDPALLASLAKFLPSSVDNVGLILDLDALASRSGLSVSNIDVAPQSNNQSNASGAQGSSSTSPVSSVDLSLSMVGTYASMQAFLDGVEKSRRLLDVHDLTVTASDTNVYTYQMIIRFYWLQ